MSFPYSKISDSGIEENKVLTFISPLQIDNKFYGFTQRCAAIRTYIIHWQLTRESSINLITRTFQNEVYINACGYYLQLLLTTIEKLMDDCI